MARPSKVERKTKETEISVELELDGSGNSQVETGIPFLNHMLEIFARHGLFDLQPEWESMRFPFWLQLELPVWTESFGWAALRPLLP